MNTKKKSSTKKKGSTTASEGQGEVSLTFKLRVDDAITDELIAAWQQHGEIFKRLLESPETPAAFRESFENIFTDHLVNKMDLTHPAVVGAFFPLVMIALQGSQPCTSDAVLDVLVTLRETLAGKPTERILAETIREAQDNG